jgi:hypothetical protein
MERNLFIHKGDRRIAEQERPEMSMLNSLIALFIMSATFSFNRKSILVSLAAATLIIAPIAFYIVDGRDGLVYSLAGMSAALLMTAPFRFFNIISGSELAVSVALGGTLGVVQYTVALCVATAFLSVQRLMKVESAFAADAVVSPSSAYDSGLLAEEEKSALVEIEALKILRRDRKDFSEAELMASWASTGTVHEFERVKFLPWCAKLALATLAVLMMGSSI